MDRYILKLFITGQTPRSQYAIRTLRQVCAEELLDRYELVIIDVIEQPQLAEEYKIIATPLLVKEWPPPARRILGDLSDREKLLMLLDFFNA
ncbi:MAG: circadian clock protein KaiB [Anaerolineae bacterium]|nr:circadian clock protein KaiB [Anaerolineae bacterium]